MKQNFTFFAVLMMALAMPKVVSAYDFSYTYQGKTLYYSINNYYLGDDQWERCVRVMNPFTTSDYVQGDVVIPDSVTYNDTSFAVKYINYSAFGHCTTLSSIVIPNTVVQIDMQAFQYCSGLTSVTLPSSITTIENNTFRDCVNLTSVIIPDSVTSIGEQAFLGCSSLTSVTIPIGVTSIGESAFSQCSSLTSVTIPEGVTSIGNNAFGNVRHIEYYGSATGSPWGAISMNGVTEGVFVYSDASKHYLLAYLGAGGAVTIPSTVDTIGNNAFSGCSSLTSVTIPNSVATIGESAFYGCSGLTSITIPDGVTTIGSFAFHGCRGLTFISIPNSVDSIGGNVFYLCDSITFLRYNCEYDNWLREISFNKSNLQSIEIGDSVENIGTYLFNNCTNLTSVTIGNSVTGIQDGAFNGCSSLASVSVPNSVTSIGDDSFRNCCGLTSITIPNSVTSIGSRAFNGCTSLTAIPIPDGVTSIGSGAFGGCTGLTSVTFPDGITAIGEGAFADCSGLTTVTFPDGITTIDEGAFAYCSGLTEIHSEASVAPLLGSNSFLDVPDSIPVYIPCGSLTSYSSQWSYFSNFIEDGGFAISFTTANFVQGHVIMLTSPTCQTPTTEILAVANSGYQFVHWSDGSTDNPRIINLTSDTVISAFFDSIPLVVRITQKYEHTPRLAYQQMGWDTVVTCTNFQLVLTAQLPASNANVVKWYIINEDGGDSLVLPLFTYDNYEAINNPYGYFTTYWFDTTWQTYAYVSPQRVSRYVLQVSYGGSNKMPVRDTITIGIDTSYDFTLTAISGTMSGTGQLNVSKQDSVLLQVTYPEIQSASLISWNIKQIRNGQDSIILSQQSTQHAITLAPNLTTGNGIDSIMVTTAVDFVSGCANYKNILIRTFPDYIENVTTYIHDTTEVIDTMTMTEYVYDTTVFTDTVTITEYITLYDTTYIDVPYAVHDTTVVIDTLTLTEYVPVHDTTYIDVHDTTYIDVHDTTYVDVHDTTIVVDTLTVTQYDTVTNTVYDTVDNYIYDTVTIRDTLWLYDTITVYDTVYITGQGVDEVDALNAKVYSSHGQIVVEDAGDHAVALYDVVGRAMAVRRSEGYAVRFDIPASGTYLVKVGSAPARRIVVVK